MAEQRRRPTAGPLVVTTATMAGALAVGVPAAAGGVPAAALLALAGAAGGLVLGSIAWGIVRLVQHIRGGGKSERAAPPEAPSP